MFQRLAFKRLRGQRSVLAYASLGIQFAARMLTCRFRTLPDFLVIGAQRCGTTSLYNYLIAHPAVLPAFVKEAHFFDFNDSKGLNWYRSYFPLASEKKKCQKLHSQTCVAGEATPYYIFHPRVPERVFAAVPDVRLIVLLRNPVDRALSHYHHEVKQGFEQRTFEDAVRCDMERMSVVRSELEQGAKFRSFEHMHHSYVARGIYIEQLRLWTRWFPREQILILDSESFYRDPASVLTKTFRFLGLSPWSANTFPKYNVSQYGQMESHTRQLLTDYYRPYNQQLYEFLNTDFGW